MSRKPFPTSAEKARKTLLGITIPRDELALRIAIGALGMTPPANLSATRILDDMDAMPPVPNTLPMGEGFRRAADQAVLYFHERINAAKQPH